MKSICVYIVLLSSIFISCGKSTEVTIVDNTSGILPNSDERAQEIGKKNVQDDFTVVKVGEMNAIQTMDPLFGITSSELRIHSMIYNGLTEWSENGELEGAVAKRWTVSRDSLRYTFTIRDNLFYHSNTRFTSGLGRNVAPEDIKMNFERMASVLVPDNAADMFSSIKGFKAFHTEQTYIKIPSNRTINSIEGITISNDSTLVFVLEKKDSKFLEKLAHPYASIYPKESLPANQNPIYEPIGTGGYYLAQRRANLLILASTEDYFKERSVPDRVDITHGKKESEIYQDFAKGELDAIIEIAPETIMQVTDSTGGIDTIFQTIFKINSPTVYNKISFYYNPDSENTSLYTYLTSQNESFLNLESALGKVYINNGSQKSDSLANNTAYVAYSNNPTEVYLVDAIAQKLSSSGVNVVMNSSYAVTDEVSFSTSYFSNAKVAITWQFPVYILTKPDVSGINVTRKSWNISFEGAIK